MIGGCRSTSAVRNLVASRDGRDEARRQRTHFWSFISIFVQVGGRNIRNLMREVVAGWRLPSSWMTGRLSLRAEILRKRDLSMSEYDQQLQAREQPCHGRQTYARPSRSPHRCKCRFPQHRADRLLTHPELSSQLAQAPVARDHPDGLFLRCRELALPWRLR